MTPQDLLTSPWLGLGQNNRRTPSAHYPWRSSAPQPVPPAQPSTHYPCENTSGVWGQSPQEESRSARLTPLAARFAFTDRGELHLQKIHYL